MEIIQHASCAVQFNDVLEIDPDFLEEWMIFRRSIEPDDFEINEDGNYVNRGGYVFTPEEYRGSPGRFLNLHPEEQPEEYAAFSQEIEDAVYQCVTKYRELFPEVGNVLWWKTPGHVASYRNGQNMGSHHDRAIDFIPESISFSAEKREELGYNMGALGNEVTSSMLLKKAEEGGLIEIRYANVSINPEPGTVLLYPSNFVGSHAVTPTTKGERLSFIQLFGQGYPQGIKTNHLLPDYEDF